MRKWIVYCGLVGVISSVTPALAQEEDSDYNALSRKVTTNSTCIDYLNSEHGEYAGDKMSESLAPDEETIGLSRAIRDECQKYPKEPLEKAVSSVKNAYTHKLSDIMEKVKRGKNSLNGKSGS